MIIERSRSFQTSEHFFTQHCGKGIGLGSRKWPTERKLWNGLCGREPNKEKEKQSSNRINKNKGAERKTGTSIAKWSTSWEVQSGMSTGLLEKRKAVVESSNWNVALHENYNFSAQKPIFRSNFFFVC